MKKGKCNLCGRIGKLSDAHVPAEKSGNVGRVFRGGVRNLSITPEGIHRIGVNPNTAGVYFRTLCVACNSYAGAHYDPEYISVSKSARTALHSSLIIPVVRLKPLAFVKSVLTNFVAIMPDNWVERYPELHDVTPKKWTCS